MAILATLGPKLALDGFALEGNANAIDIGTTVEVKLITTFANVPFEAFTPGLRTLDLAIGGFNDYAAGALDEWLRANLGAPHVTTIAPAGDAIGNLAVLTRGLLGGYQPFRATVGDVPAVALTVRPTGVPIAEGLVTQASTTAITVTGNTTPQQVGAPAAGRTVYAAIHALSVTGTTPSAIFQLASSATFGGAYTARGSAGAAITAAGGQLLSVAGPFTDAFWRLNVTVTGTTPSFAVFAAIAIA